MIVVYTDEFKKQFKELPERVQQTYRKQEALLKIDPFDPRLHGKSLNGYDGIFSFRVTRSYRVLYSISENTIVICLTIAHRKDVYR